MSVFGQAGQLDGEIFGEMEQEVAGLLQELVTIKRFTSLTAGDPAKGEGAAVNFTSCSTTALAEPLSAAEINFPNSIYQAGDVRMHVLIEVFGATGAAGGDGQAANRRSDQIIWRGREYKIIGIPDRVHFGGQYYWQTVLRLVKAA